MNTSAMAQGLAGLGRNGDSVLVHMQPQEVAGLQSLAQANGTSLTINPDTGMPEAFNLGKMFKSMSPFLAGLAISLIPGAPVFAPALGGAVVGGLTNKKNPLMGAALGAAGGYGGGNVATAALGKTSAVAGAAPAGTIPVEASANMLQPYSQAVAPNMAATNMTSAGLASEVGARNLGAAIPMDAATNAATSNSMLGSTGTFENYVGRKGLGLMGGETEAVTSQLAEPTFSSNLSQAYDNVAADPMGFIKDNPFGVGAPLVMGGLAGMEGPSPGMSKEEYEAEQRRKFGQPLDLNYDTGLRLAAGGSIQNGGVMDLYQSGDSQAMFGGNQGFGLGRLNNLAQQQAASNAEVGRFASGGVPKLEDGGFVVPADVTFYMGEHNTEAGQRRLAEMYGGQPIRGAGTGLSDSIPTNIEGKEPARIANGEVYIPRKAVMANGGPDKFYKMMDKVRKKATGSTKQARAA